MSKLDKEQMKMVEVQADMMDLFVKYADNMDEAIAIAFKTVLDCYVAQLGREGTVGMLDHAKITVNMGKHDILGADLPKNLIN
jgi:hypothetical protein